MLALVSGGADSLCLWGVLRELGYQVEALHVEHGLRGEAAGRRDALRRAGRDASSRWTSPPGGNLEARAREARYAAAREHAGGRSIATGHTLSDQAETVLYRLASSSGAACAQRRCARGRRHRAAAPVRDGGRDARVVRRRRARAAARRDQRRLAPAPQPDPPRGDAGAAPVHPGAEVNLARTAELLGELDELLAELADPHVEPRIDLDGLAGLPRGLRVLVLREAAERAAGRPLRLPRELTGRLEAARRAAGGVERLSLGRDLEAVRDRAYPRLRAPGRGILSSR